MAKRWKLKTNSSNILLVLITLILVKAEWGSTETPDSSEISNSIDSDEELIQSDHVQIYVGNDEIAEYFFGSSTKNNSLILDEIRKCLDTFQLITCAKMLLLNKITDAVNLMEDPNVNQKNLYFLNGILTFAIKNETTDVDLNDSDENLSLDDEIAMKVRKLFRKRSLLVNLFPKTKIEIEPSPQQRQGDFICFSYKIKKELDSAPSNDEEEGRKRKKGGGMNMMMLPPLIMMGLMPFTLASIKAMVMNAVMINMMALNGAIFMTIRNLVFGPRQGDNVQYVNYGYSKDRQTQKRRPALIIHSPAAFVKQPPVHKNVHPHHPHVETNYFPDHHSNGGSYHQSGHNSQDYEEYYIIQDDSETNQGHHHNRRQQIQRRNEFSPFVPKYSTTNQTNRPKPSELRYVRPPQKFQKGGK